MENLVKGVDHVFDSYIEVQNLNLKDVILNVDSTVNDIDEIIDEDFVLKVVNVVIVEDVSGYIKVEDILNRNIEKEINSIIEVVVLKNDKILIVEDYLDVDVIDLPFGLDIFL